MQISEKFILEFAVLTAVTILVAFDKLDPSIFVAVLGVIFGERVYTAVRRRDKA